MSFHQNVIDRVARNTTQQIKINRAFTVKHFVQACINFQHQFTGWHKDTFFASYGDTLFIIDPNHPAIIKEGREKKPITTRDTAAFYRQMFDALPLEFFKGPQDELAWSFDQYLEVMLAGLYNRVKPDQAPEWSFADAWAMITAHSDKTPQYFDFWEEAGEHPHRIGLVYLLSFTPLLGDTPKSKSKEWALDSYLTKYGAVIEDLEKGHGLFRFYDLYSA